MIEPTITILNLRANNNQLRKERKELIEEIKNLRGLIGIETYPKDIKEIPKSNGIRSKFLLLSDIHIERIPKKKIEKMFGSLLSQIKAILKKGDLLNVMFLGDLINNVLLTHQVEDLMSNRLTPFEAVEELINNLIWLYKGIRDIGVKINTYSIQGNHSRTLKSELFEHVGRLSYDQHVIRLLQKAFPYESFHVSNNRHEWYKIGNTKIRITHQLGSHDNLRTAKEEKFKFDMQKKADIVFAAHNHSYMQSDNICINGSWMVNDEYSQNKGFPAQTASQTYLEVENKKISLVKLLYI